MAKPIRLKTKVVNGTEAYLLYKFSGFWSESAYLITLISTQVSIRYVGKRSNYLNIRWS